MQELLYSNELNYLEAACVLKHEIYIIHKKNNIFYKLKAAMIGII